MTEARRSLDRFQRLALVTTAATYLLIAVGGLVRASGSGLGCPDWPRCFDRWIPPLRASDVPSTIDPALFNFAKAWTEYVNRLLGVAVGFLILATLIAAFKYHRRARSIVLSTIAAFLLVGVEGAIGGKVVASKLSPGILTLHLVLALVIASLLVYATVSAFFPQGRRAGELPRDQRLLGRLTLAVAALALAQVWIGAGVRAEVQTIATRAPALAREAWLSGLGPIMTVHRLFALVVTAAIVALAAFVHSRSDRDRWLEGVAFSAAGLAVLQGLAGAALTSWGLPAVLQVAHLWIGSILIGLLNLLCLLAYRLDPRQAPPLSVDSPRRVD